MKENVGRLNEDFFRKIFRLKDVTIHRDCNVLKVCGTSHSGYRIYLVFLEGGKIKTILKVRDWSRPYSYLINGQPCKNTETWRGLKRVKRRHPSVFVSYNSNWC